MTMMRAHEEPGVEEDEAEKIYRESAREKWPVRLKNN